MKYNPVRICSCSTKNMKLVKTIDLLNFFAAKNFNRWYAGMALRNEVEFPNGSANLSEDLKDGCYVAYYTAESASSTYQVPSDRPSEASEGIKKVVSLHERLKAKVYPDRCEIWKLEDTSSYLLVYEDGSRYFRPSKDESTGAHNSQDGGFGSFRSNY